MRSSICALPGFPTRAAKSSKVIWVGLPSRISTIVPPGSNGFLIAAASRFAMPSNIAVIGDRTAWASVAEGSAESGVAACSELIRKPAAVAAAKNKIKSERLKSFMAPDCKPSVIGKPKTRGNLPGVCAEQREQKPHHGDTEARRKPKKLTTKGTRRNTKRLPKLPRLPKIADFKILPRFFRAALFLR